MSASPLLTTESNAHVPRRTFLRVAGATSASAALVLAGCSDDSSTPTDPYLVPLANSDTGLLNYVYLLEQLEAAFYQKVVDAPPTDLQPGELAYFTDLRDHELIHRETLLFALGTNAVTLPSIDFSSVNFTTRAGVLAAAKTFEDLGVAAYNGALAAVSDGTTLRLLSKMASVEARHAAYISDLLTPGSFATGTVADDSGLLAVAVTQTPAQVISATAAFFAPVKISVDSLPTA